MIIIVEGQDRVGKTTQIELLRNSYVHSSPVVKYSKIKPKYKHNPEHIFEKSKLLYEEMFNMIFDSAADERDLILDRAHLGEYVYSKRYRSYSGKYVFDLEKQFVNDVDLWVDNIYLIILINSDLEELYKRDDCLSHSNAIEAMATDKIRFMKAYKKSTIPNKCIIDCNGLTSDVVHKKILEFLKLKPIVEEKMSDYEYE
jgi:thymidylate kinase